MQTESAGLWSPGNRVKCIRDLTDFEHKIESSITDEPYPKRGEIYLIDECHDFVGRRNINFVSPSMLNYRIKLYAFTMKCDKAGFLFLFNTRDFTMVDIKI